MSLYVVLLFILLKLSGGYFVNSHDAVMGDANFGEEYESRGNEPKDSDSVDWRLTNDVSPVKDQGRCAACWAFAITGAIESHASIHLKRKVVLSEQFLMDCLPNSRGCELTSILKAYSDIVSTTGGVLANRDYNPYEERQRRCRWKHSSALQLAMKPNLNRINGARLAVMVVGMTRVKPNEDVMARVIARSGPVTAAINAVRMEKYKSGDNYIDEPSVAECNPDNLTHTVTIVGYASSKRDDGRKVDYWIIKNSWGNSFGDNGYYYLVRGRNACGISNDVVVPTVARS